MRVFDLHACQVVGEHPCILVQIWVSKVCVKGCGCWLTATRQSDFCQRKTRQVTQITLHTKSCSQITDQSQVRLLAEFCLLCCMLHLSLPCRLLGFLVSLRGKTASASRARSINSLQWAAAASKHRSLSRKARANSTSDGESSWKLDNAGERCGNQTAHHLPTGGSLLPFSLFQPEQLRQMQAEMATGRSALGSCSTR